MTSPPVARIVALALLALAVALPCLAQAAAPPLLDLENVAFRGLKPGTSTSADVKAVLGEPTRADHARVMVYEPLSLFVELVPNTLKTEVMTINLLLVPSGDVFGAWSLRRLAGNPELAAALQKEFPYDTVAALPKVKKTAPKGMKILHVSRQGRTCSLAYDATTLKLKQVMLYNF